MSSISSRLRDYYALTKPEVNLLILITTSAGYVLGNQGAFHVMRLFHTLGGTLLVASGTATLNQYMERNYDGEMRRTGNRPLPSGRLIPLEALLFGICLSVAGALYLLLAVNALSAVAAIFTLLSYLLIYTPLKRRTPFCTFLGAIPGAMPALIGWGAASGVFEWRAGLLFLVLFLWQFPHFLAIALMYREDYERAGYRMLPEFDDEGRFTRVEIVVFAIAVTAASIAFLASDRSPSAPLLVLLGLGGFLLHGCLKLAHTPSRIAAARVLHATVIYLPAVLAVLIWHKY